MTIAGLIATKSQRPVLNTRLLQVHEEPFERFCCVIPRSVFLNAGVMCLRRFLLVAEQSTKNKMLIGRAR